jgi:hypothetical protein
MKYTRMLICVLFLMALLQGAGNAVPETTHRTPESQTVATSPSPRAIVHATPIPAISPRMTGRSSQFSPALIVGDRQKSLWDYLPPWLEAGATLLLVVFAIFQMHFVRRTTTASEVASTAAKDSAAAAKESADAAKLAVQSDRPYMLVAEAKLKGVISDDTRTIEPNANVLKVVSEFLKKPEKLNPHNEFLPRAEFLFKNYGKGPARIVQLVAGMSLVRVLPKPKDFFGCMPIRTSHVGVGNGEPLLVENIFGLDLWLSETDIDDIGAERKKLIVYGKLTYSDIRTIPDPYEAGFLWIFSPPRPFSVGGGKPIESLVIPSSFSAGPDEYNINT